MHSCSEPGDVGMPEECAPLVEQGELVRETLTSLNWTLSYVGGAVEPASQPLSNAMPALWNSSLIANSRHVHITVIFVQTIQLYVQKEFKIVR